MQRPISMPPTIMGIQQAVLTCMHLSPLELMGHPRFSSRGFGTLRVNRFQRRCSSFFTQVRGLNETFITLIPKTASPIKVDNFRPISLCDTSYKVIVNILTTRLKSVMPHLIGPEQNVFVLGQSMTEIFFYWDMRYFIGLIVNELVANFMPC